MNTQQRVRVIAACIVVAAGGQYHKDKEGNQSPLAPDH